MIDMLITIEGEVYAVRAKMTEFNNVSPTIKRILYCNNEEWGNGYEIMAEEGDKTYYIFIPFHQAAKIKAFL